MSDKIYPPLEERTEIYQSGKRTYMAGGHLADCPYLFGAKRGAWIGGWFDAHREQEPEDV